MTPTQSRSFRRIVRTFGAIALALVLVASSGCKSKEEKQASDLDRAFVVAMVPNAELAVKLGQIASGQTKNRDIKALANRTVSGQEGRIAVLKANGDRIGADLDKKDIGAAATTLGISQAQMGLEGDVEKLARSKPVEPVFLSMLIPNQQGAVKLAEAEANKGTVPALKQLANEVIATQSQEVLLMKDLLAKYNK